jgi:hypothetical protein
VVGESAHSLRQIIGLTRCDINNDRRERVAKTIRDINPDILCMLEARGVKKLI